MVLPVIVLGVLAGLLRKEGRSMTGITMEPGQWKQRSDVLSLVFIVFFFSWTVLNKFEYIVFPVELVEAVIPWWWMELVQSLTFEDAENHSMCYKAMTHKMWLKLGRISYSLYLIHQVVPSYIHWICDAGQVTASGKVWNAASIPLNIAVSIILAFILNNMCYILGIFIPLQKKHDGS